MGSDANHNVEAIVEVSLDGGSRNLIFAGTLAGADEAMEMFSYDRMRSTAKSLRSACTKRQVELLDPQPTEPKRDDSGQDFALAIFLKDGMSKIVHRGLLLAEALVLLNGFENEKVKIVRIGKAIECHNSESSCTEVR